MHTEKQIAFDQIKERWACLAVTEWAKEKIRCVEICLDEAVLRRQLKDTSNSRQMMQRFGAPPLQSLTQMQEILGVAKKGGCLMPGQLEQVETVLAMVRRFKDYLKRGKEGGNPLAYYEENLDAAQSLRDEIGRQIRNGGVDDHATKELARIRSQIAVCEEQMKQKAEQAIHARRGCMADYYCTSRNGRICIPVKKECKGKVPGTVIDKSASGNTLFIEPAAVAGYYEKMQLLKMDEENEASRILYVLTAMVADAAGMLEENAAVIEKLDFIFSKGKLSMDLQATEPAINTEKKIVLKDARHPLMDPEQNVPLQFAAGTDTRGIVITGPNTGGKTVALKTVMLNCMMAQCGLHVTCKEADICMCSSYLCDTGDGQDIAQNLSTFSAHMKNVLEVLEEVDENSLVVLDELGSGTDPAEGMGIAVAVLDELRKSGALFLVTTHYPQVKEYAAKTPGVVNARMAFDKKTLRPTYQMQIGEAGESCAFYIAQRLGMPQKMLEAAAYAAYGEGTRAGGQAPGERIFAAPFGGIEEGKEQNGTRLKSNAARPARRLIKEKAKKGKRKQTEAFRRGDSVMVYPDKKIGIVCEPANERGVLQVQMPGKKIWINHKRVKLHVAAEKLYPADYDFSILFEAVAVRKARHEMERKYTSQVLRHDAQPE